MPGQIRRHAGKSVFSTLPEGVGERAFPASCATIAPGPDSEDPRPPGLMTQPHSLLFLSLPHSMLPTQRGLSVLKKVKHLSTERTSLLFLKHPRGALALCPGIGPSAATLSCFRPAGLPPGPRSRAGPNTAPALAHSQCLTGLEVLESRGIILASSFLCLFLLKNQSWSLAY